MNHNQSVNAGVLKRFLRLRNSVKCQFNMNYICIIYTIMNQNINPFLSFSFVVPSRFLWFSGGADPRCNLSGAWLRWAVASHVARPRGPGPSHAQQGESNLLSSSQLGINMREIQMKSGTTKYHPNVYSKVKMLRWSLLSWTFCACFYPNIWRLEIGRVSWWVYQQVAAIWLLPLPLHATFSAGRNTWSPLWGIGDAKSALNVTLSPSS